MASKSQQILHSKQDQIRNCYQVNTEYLLSVFPSRPRHHLTSCSFCHSFFLKFFVFTAIFLFVSALHASLTSYRYVLPFCSFCSNLCLSFYYILSSFTCPLIPFSSTPPFCSSSHSFSCSTFASTFISSLPSPPFAQPRIITLRCYFYRITPLLLAPPSVYPLPVFPAFSSSRMPSLLIREPRCCKPGLSSRCLQCYQYQHSLPLALPNPPHTHLPDCLAAKSRKGGEIKMK